jgi:hypothetical protein
MPEERCMSPSNIGAVALVAVVWLLPSCSARAGDDSAYKRFTEVLAASVVAQKDGKAINAGNLMKRLDELDQLGEAADKPLVDFLDYYIGEGPKAFVYELIVQRGQRMVPLLNAKKASPLKCLPEYKSLCLSEEEKNSRDRRIDGLVEWITQPESARPGP